MRRVALALSLIAAPLAAQQQPTFDLSVRNIMRGPELYGREPAQVRWTADGQWIYFRWLEPGAAWNKTLIPYRIAPRADATPERVSDAHMDSVAPMLATGPRSRDGRLRVVVASGDIWVQQRDAQQRVTLRRVTQTTANESAPRIAPDGRTLFVNIQHPGESPSERSDPAAPQRISNWPDKRRGHLMPTSWEMIPTFAFFPRPATFP